MDFFFSYIKTKDRPLQLTLKKVVGNELSIECRKISKIKLPKNDLIIGQNYHYIERAKIYVIRLLRCLGKIRTPFYSSILIVAFEIIFLRYPPIFERIKKNSRI